MVCWKKVCCVSMCWERMCYELMAKTFSVYNNSNKDA